MGTTGKFLRGLERIGDQRIDRHRRIDDAIDERTVGAVFQQAPHQIRQQGPVRSDRCIDPARHAELRGADHLVVQRFAHAVQALELVIGDAFLPRPVIHRCQRLRIVRGELGIQPVRMHQQLARTNEVAHVGMQLAGIDRIIGQAIDLGALDFGIPVRSFHQADHEFTTAALAQVDQEIEHVRAALLVRLHHETDAVETRQLRIERQGFQQIQRQLQAVGFLGVDVDADRMLLGQQHQAFQARQQLRHHPRTLCPAIARMQCREFDRNTGATLDATTGGSGADRVDRGLVGGQVASRIVFGDGGFAQHVIRILVAAINACAAVGQGGIDGLARDELVAEHAHGEIHALADQRLATACDQSRDRRRQALLAAGGDQLAGD